MRKMLGIDVSKHQGSIDWAKMKPAGVEFAIIRAGYGWTYTDPYFVQNITDAIANGIKVGVYWFIYGVDEAEAIRNAEKAHEVLAPYADKISLKVWCDLEYDTDRYASNLGVTLTKDVRTAMVKAFNEHLKSLGYEVGVYANPDYLKNKFNELSEYPLWLAHYTEDEKRYCDCDIWQYTSDGTVDGINGKVDMNIMYVEEKVAPDYYDSPEFTLIESLNKIGVDSSYAHRAKIAAANNIQNYQGSVEQNLLMLQLLNEGKLIVA